MALEGNGWVVVRTSDGSETLRVQQRYLEKRPKEHSGGSYPYIAPRTRNACASTQCIMCDPLGHLSKLSLKERVLCPARHFPDVPSQPANVQDEALEAEGARPLLAPQGSDEHGEAHAEEDGMPTPASLRLTMLRLPHAARVSILSNAPCAPTAWRPRGLAGL